MKKKYFVIFLLITLSLSILYSSNGAWKHYIYTDGISSNYVFDISKDEYDRIWASTQNGVTLIDGSKIIKFGLDSGLPASDIIKTIHFNNETYVATANKGLFKLVKNHFQKTKIIKGSIIYTMEIIDEKIFISTNLENITFDGDDVSFMGYGFPNDRVIDTYFNNGKTFYASIDKIIEEKNDGYVAFKIDFPNDKTNIQALLVDGEIEYIGTNKGLYTRLNKTKVKLVANTNVLSLAKSLSGDYLVGTTKGIYKLVDGKLKSYTLGGLLHQANIKSPVRDIEVISSNEIWISTFGMGFYLNDPGTFKNYSLNDNLNLKGMVFDVLFIKDKLFIATKNGLFIYQDNKLVNHYTIKDGLPSNTILDIDYNQKGELWLATTNGLCHFNNTKFKNYSTKEGLPSQLITSVHIDKKNNSGIWIGSKNSGLTRLKDNQFFTFSMKDGLPSNHVTDITQSSNGNIVIACYKAGLTVYDGQDFTLFQEGLADRRVIDVEVDSEDRLWVGTESAGVGVLEDKKFKMIKDSDGLAHNEIFSLFYDERRMWVGTFGGGVSCFINDVWVTLRESDGLNSNTIGAIAMLSDGKIALGGENGISIFTMDNSSFKLYIDKILTPNLELEPIIEEEPQIFGIVNDRFFIDVNPMIYNPTGADINYRTRVLSDSNEPKVPWSDFGLSSQISFVPESVGKFELEIQAVDNRMKFSNIINIPFNIKRVWYLDPKTAIPFWGSIILLIVFSIISYMNYLKKSKEAQELRDAEIARKDAEMEEAREFQQGLLPKNMPSNDNYEMIGFQQTATEVGGDFFDFMKKEDGDWIAICGDATGHGLTSGNVVSITKTAISALAEEDPVATLDSLNKTLLKMNIGLNRMCLNIANLGKDSIRFSSAGMPPAYYYSAQKSELEEIMVGALPLGSFKNAMHTEKEISFKNSGDILVMMSDGLPEAENINNEMVGYERTLDKINSIAHKSVEEIKNGLVELCEEWLDGHAELKDDMTFVIIKKK